jgi:hypothetical protein
VEQKQESKQAKLSFSHFTSFPFTSYEQEGTNKHGLAKTWNDLFRETFTSLQLEHMYFIWADTIITMYDNFATMHIRT